MAYQASGVEIRMAMQTSPRKSRESKQGDIGHRSAQHFADADLPRRCFGGEDGEAEEAEAGDEIVTMVK